jgi:hypothetical protein
MSFPGRIRQFWACRPPEVGMKNILNTARKNLRSSILRQ